MPLTVCALANAYLMAANLGAYGYVGLTSGAARLIESFGSDALRRNLHATACTTASGPAPWRSPSPRPAAAWPT